MARSAADALRSPAALAAAELIPAERIAELERVAARYAVSLTPQVAYTNNQSNIELNEYDRTVASVSVRRDF